MEFLRAAAFAITGFFIGNWFSAVTLTLERFNSPFADAPQNQFRYDILPPNN